MNKILLLDTFSDTIIKQSLVGKLLQKSFKNKLEVDNKTYKYFQYIFYVLLSILIVSLILPIFAEDRLGIGVIIIFCGVGFLPFIFLKKNTIINFNSIDLAVFLFLFSLIISTFSSYFFIESLKGLFKYFLFILTYFIFKFTFLNSEKKVNVFFINLLLFCTVLVSSYGIYQYFGNVEPLATWEDSNFENTHTRVYSTLGNPNLLAGFLLVTLPIFFFYPFIENLNSLKKFIYVSCGLVNLTCLIFTGSRGGYIGLLTGVIVSFLIGLNFLFKKFKNKLNFKYIFLFLLVFFISLVILNFAFPIFTERLNTIFTLREHSSNNYRVNVWISSFKMLRDNWLLGIGPGNTTFRLVYGIYMISGFDALSAYNIFLETAIEGGILGILFFLLIIFLSLAKLHYLFWEKNVYFSLCIVISIVSLLAHGITDTVFFRPQIYIPFWFLLSYIGKLNKEN